MDLKCDRTFAIYLHAKALLCFDPHTFTYFSGTVHLTGDVTDVTYCLHPAFGVCLWSICFTCRCSDYSSIIDHWIGCNRRRLELLHRFTPPMNRTLLVPANSRGGTVWIHNGFRYRRQSKNRSRFQWLCTNPGCSAYLTTDCFDYKDEGNIVGRSLTHAYCKREALFNNYKY